MKVYDLDKELQKLKELAGIVDTSGRKDSSNPQSSPLTYGGTERAEYMRKHNILPGTDEWFKLWFAREALTGEDRFPRDNK
jgi:hypothetical protein